MPTPTIVRGDDLMLFKGGKSIAYATAHTLSMSGETADVSSKDHGKWGATEVTKVTWEITTDNLYTDTAFEDLYDAMMKMEKIQVVFGNKKEEAEGATVADGSIANWSPVETPGKVYQGEAFITSLTANANTGEKATFSATFTGVGKLDCKVYSAA